MKALIGLILFLLSLPAIAQDAKVVFADTAKGRTLLSTADQFTENLSPFDRQARARLAEAPSAEEFLTFVGKAAIDWSEKERTALQESWERLRPKLAALGVSLPDETIYMIRTDGKEEVGAAYTRGTSIIFHPGSVAPGKQLDGLLAHELFHIISRNDPKLRDQFYAIIGFTPCGEVPFPKSLAARKITNPDAPLNQHSITVKIDGEARPALPILIAGRKFDPKRKESLFGYVMLQFLVIEKKGERWVGAERKDGSPHIASPMRIKGFTEQIGENTGYIIHPEEILADNFKHLILEKKGLPNPEIVEKMGKVFAEAKKKRER